MDIKQLRKRATELKTQLKMATNHACRAVQHKEAIRSSLDEIENEIQKVLNETKEPVVNEHAILRYLERVLGMDMEDIKRKIVTPKVREMIMQFSDGKILNLEGGFSLVVKQKEVISIVGGESEP